MTRRFLGGIVISSKTQFIIENHGFPAKSRNLAIRASIISFFQNGWHNLFWKKTYHEHLCSLTQSSNRSRTSLWQACCQNDSGNCTTLILGPLAYESRCSTRQCIQEDPRQSSVCGLGTGQCRELSLAVCAGILSLQGIHLSLGKDSQDGSPHSVAHCESSVASQTNTYTLCSSDAWRIQTFGCSDSLSDVLYRKQNETSWNCTLHTTDATRLSEDLNLFLLQMLLTTTTTFDTSQ